MNNKLIIFIFAFSILSILIGGLAIVKQGTNNHLELEEEVHILEKLAADRNLGQRYTACDAKRHLVYEHGKPEEILNDCLAYPITQIEKLRLSGFTY